MYVANPIRHAVASTTTKQVVVVAVVYTDSSHFRLWFSSSDHRT